MKILRGIVAKFISAIIFLFFLSVVVKWKFFSPDDYPKKGTEFQTFSAGNEGYPVWLLYSLTHDGKNMLEWMEYYGFPPSPNSYIPQGISLVKGDVLSLKNHDKIGFTCSSCHTGSFRHDGKLHTVDGMPRMVDPESWLILVMNTLEDTLKHQDGKTYSQFLSKAFEYMVVGASRRTIRESPSEPFSTFHVILGNSVDDISETLIETLTDEELLQESNDKVAFLEGFHDQLENIRKESNEILPSLDFSSENRKRYYAEVYPTVNVEEEAEVIQLYKDKKAYQIGMTLVNDIRHLLKQKSTVEQMEKSYRSGLSRNAAWGTIDIMVGDFVGNFDAPISVPHLFQVNSNQWHHLDGNIGSTLNRNLLQSLALGRKADFNTGETEVTYHELLAMDNVVASIKTPEWNDYFPKLNKSLIKDGKKIYEEKRYSNYKAYNIDGELVSTSSPVSCADCHVVPEESKDQLFYDVGTSSERWEYYYKNPQILARLSTRLEKVSNAIIEQAKRDGLSVEQEDATLYPRRGYLARPLKGLWATSPYLHNGSVPDLVSLLEPYENRPKSFWLGNLEYDTQKVGYYTKGQPKGVYATKFFEGDIPGNSVKGHEFGALLEPEEKNALLEYLKSL